MSDTGATERGITAPVVFVIVGVTGDLARAKLLPAIAALVKGGALSGGFRVVGTTRRADMAAAEVLGRAAGADVLEGHFELFAGSLEDADAARRLNARLDAIGAELGGGAVRVIHLSLPPAAMPPIISALADAGCLAADKMRLLLEKPFGTSLASARELDAFLAAIMAQDDIYRIDHYLEKRMARAISEGSVSLPELSAGGAARIEVIASEKEDVGRRADFYDQVGALRDVLENHLLALLATLLAAPKSGPEGRLEALQGLRIGHTPGSRMQYEGYREAVGKPESAAETFASVSLVSSDPRYAGAAITLATGKALKEKRTEIRISMKSGESAVISFDNDFIERSKSGTAARVPLPALAPFDGYAAAYQDAIAGNRQFFVGRAEAIEAWRVVQPVIDAWERETGTETYARGTAIEDLIGNSSKL